LLIDDVIFVLEKEEKLDVLFSEGFDSMKLRDAVAFCDESFVMDYLFATKKLEEKYLEYIEKER
jgi:hypothetical protein